MEVIMNILVIGGGGRESAICWKLSQSKNVEKIYAVPGNAGISNIAQCIEIDYENDFSHLTQLVEKQRIDFTIVGPETPLVNGIVDHFQKKGYPIFGPSKRAALLEGSKVFAKRFMKKYLIPTADFKVFSDPDKAMEYIKKEGCPRIIKADGLAAGKGSLIVNNEKEAEEAIKSIMIEKIFGKAGEKVIIEEKLEGKEISFFVLTDGENIKPLISSQDYKRIYEEDKGPNTGGMGAYSPAPLSFPLYKKIMKEIIIPTLEGMKKEKREYRGVLYTGLMIEKDQPKVLEFNVRFGDPETQVTLPRLKTDLLDILFAVSEKKLNRINLEWRSQAAVCVVLASKGYPESYEKGKRVEGLENLALLKNIFPFCAGLKRENGNIVTNGGRVIGITALGKNLKKAIKQSYKKKKKIHFEGMYYRKDIGYKGIKKS